MNNFDLNQISKFKTTPLGIEQYSQLTVEEWKNLGACIGSAARSMAFVIGDWIMYGNTLLGVVGEGQDRPQADTLKLATDSTGIDIPLSNPMRMWRGNCPWNAAANGCPGNTTRPLPGFRRRNGSNGSTSATPSRTPHHCLPTAQVHQS